MSNIENESRAQFEAWARSKGLDLEYRNFPGIGQFYECPRTLLALEAWQASRQALVVELPDAVVGARRYQHAESAFAHKEGIDECRATIESQGVKCK